METRNTQNTDFLISDSEISTARFCMEYGITHGASQMKISLSKSVLDSFSILNGELDKVVHSADRSLFMYIFADGRYGTFSTNNFSRKDLEAFITKAIDTVRMLAADPSRKLPPAERTAKGAVTGTELGLYDPEYQNITPEKRLKTAMGISIFRTSDTGDGITLISEECEYSDSVDDNYLIDSQGFEGRHTETSFAVCSEVTIQDKSGNRLSGYWWESSPSASGLNTEGCSRIALEKALNKIGPKRHKGGKFRMIVDRSVSSRLVSPLLSALNGTAIQQKNSFLDGSIGKKMFSGNLTIMDLATTYGKPGSRLFDTEGVATADRAIIKDGIVSQYFINTYISEKTGMSPTIEGASRPAVTPFMKLSAADADGCLSSEKEITLQAIMESCGDGIYVTGFNGGNCNQTTGDFSYGIEGFAFRKGKISHPIREMVVTGNMKELWNSITAAGSDARPCTRWQIPTLAFDDVDFSA